jgi:hypothetical protein
MSSVFHLYFGGTKSTRHHVLFTNIEKERKQYGITFTKYNGNIQHNLS